jgi:hypothetical protein
VHVGGGAGLGTGDWAPGTGGFDKQGLAFERVDGVTVTNTALGFNHSDTTPHPAPGWASSCVDTTAADGAVCFVNVTCDGKPF